MRRPRSLQSRLSLTLGAALALIWIAVATITALILRHETNEVFDSALRQTAEHILPLAALDIVGRDDDGITQRLASVGDDTEVFTYLLRDARGRILLQSQGAEAEDFPPYDGRGFRQTPTHRLYNDDVLQGSLRITIAEPLDHRRTVAREIQFGLGLPLLVVIPLALLAILWAVRASLTSLRRFREGLGARSARDLSPVPTSDLPSEITPIAATLNTLLARLNSAFEAERSFAANAAHELRTPLAGALAQAQRLQSETTDAAARQRAAEIEATLKRLTRLSERLMQLARAEGGRLRLGHAADLRPVARIVLDDMTRMAAPGRIRLSLPDAPVLSDLDPDAFGILFRNLIDNALRHATPGTPIDVTLRGDGHLSVANDSPVVPPEVLSRLTLRFERAEASAEGSGLGLAIVAAIAERIASPLRLSSPRPGAATGFEAALTLPVEVGSPQK